MFERSLTGRTTWIWSKDPALDTAAADYAAQRKKAEEDFAMDALPLKPGAVPVRFEIRVLPARIQARLLDMKDAPNQQCLEFVRHGLVAVTGLTAANGAPFALQRNEKEGTVEPDSIERLYDLDLFAELGTAVFAFSRLRP